MKKQVTMTIDGKTYNGTFESDDLETKAWELVRGEEVYVLLSSGFIDYRRFDGDASDISLLDRGRITRTREPLERLDAREVATATIARFIEAEGLGFEPDWSDSKQLKWSPTYTHGDETYTAGFCRVCQDIGVPFYYKSEADCDRVNVACKAELDVLRGRN